MELRLDAYGVQQNTLQTKEIQAVLDAATAAGGLTVVIPRGTYISGSLNLGTASLHLEKGAVLMGSPDINDYPHNGFRHNEMRQCTSLLYAMHAEGIAITGDGVIDLNAEAFYQMDEGFVPEDGHEYSEEQLLECPRKYPTRPSQPIFFYDCKHVTMQDIVIRNAPCWTISFHKSEDIRVMNLTIENGMTIPNSDGMHFCGCKNVFVHGCNIAAGDDCIALSGITDWNEPCENVVISDCIMTSTSKALSIGYMHSIVRNVTVTNCIIYAAQRGIAFMASKGTGLIEHVMINNLRIDTKIRAGNWWGNGEPICFVGTYHHYDGYLDPAPERSLSVNIRDVKLTNISCTAENIIGVIGSGGNIDQVLFRDITFQYKESKNRYLKGDRCIDISPSAETCTLPEDFDGAIYVRDCGRVQLENIIQL